MTFEVERIRGHDLEEKTWTSQQGAIKMPAGVKFADLIPGLDPNACIDVLVRPACPHPPLVQEPSCSHRISIKEFRQQCRSHQCLEHCCGQLWVWHMFGGQDLWWTIPLHIFHWSCWDTIWIPNDHMDLCQTHCKQVPDLEAPHKAMGAGVLRSATKDP